LDPAEIFKPTIIRYNLLQSVPRGIEMGWTKMVNYVKQLKLIFTPEGAQSLGGFGTIGSIFPSSWDWVGFWSITAFISVILAVMNLLPIPALDGGHVVFLLYEMITRRKPSENFMIKAEYIGITILFILLIIANLNDVLRWLGFM
jgi:regulator of sigma E protease